MLWMLPPVAGGGKRHYGILFFFFFFFEPNFFWEGFFSYANLRAISQPYRNIPPLSEKKASLA